MNTNTFHINIEEQQLLEILYLANLKCGDILEDVDEDPHFINQITENLALIEMIADSITQNENTGIDIHVMVGEHTEPPKSIISKYRFDIADPIYADYIYNYCMELYPETYAEACDVYKAYHENELSMLEYISYYPDVRNVFEDYLEEYFEANPECDPRHFDEWEE